MLKDIFELDSMGSLMNPESRWYSLSVDDKLMDGLHTLLNFCFQIFKLFVAGVDFSIRTFFKMDILGSRLSTVFESGDKIWDSVYSTFGVVFLTIVLILIVRDFFTKGFQKVMLRLGLFIMIVLASAVFFNSGSKLVGDINTISNDAQAKLMKVASPVNSTYTDELLEQFGLEKKEGIEGVRNMMYATFVYQPYALMNFGRTDISKKQYTDYLIEKKADVDERQEEIGDKVKESSEKNSYLTVRKLGDKYVVLLNALLNFIIVGSAVFILALGNLLLQLMIYILIFLFGIILMIALLPDKENVLFNGLKGFLALFGIKILLGLGFGLLFTVINLIDGLFTEMTIVTVLVALVIKILVFMFVWKKWSNIVSFLNGSGSILDLFIKPSEMKNIPTKFPFKKRSKNNNTGLDEQQSIQGEMLVNQYEETNARLEMSQDYRDNMRLHANDLEDSNNYARFSNDSEDQSDTLDSENGVDNVTTMTGDNAGIVNEDDSTNDPTVDIDGDVSVDDITDESNETSDYRSPDDILLADVDDEDFNVESNDEIADNRMEDMIYEEERINDLTSLDGEMPVETADNDDIASHRTEDMITNESSDNDETAHNRAEDIISEENVQENSVEDTLSFEHEDAISPIHLENESSDNVNSNVPVQDETSLPANEHENADLGINSTVSDKEVSSTSTINDGILSEDSVQPVGDIDTQDVPVHDTEFKEVRSDLNNESS